MYNSLENSFCEPNGIIEINSEEDIIHYFDNAKNNALQNWISNFSGAAQL